MPIAAGKRGHPIAIASKHFPEVLANFDGIGLHGLLDAHPDDLYSWPITDAEANPRPIFASAAMDPPIRPYSRRMRLASLAMVLNGVLWVLRTGAPWADLPSRYPPYQTCHRRFRLWQRSGRLDRLLERLAADLRDRGKIDLTEAFVDATFAGAKKGALRSVQRAVARAPKSWRSATAMVFLSPCTWPALHRMSRTSSRRRSTPAS